MPVRVPAPPAHHAPQLPHPELVAHLHQRIQFLRTLHPRLGYQAHEAGQQQRQIVPVRVAEAGYLLFDLVQQQFRPLGPSFQDREQVRGKRRGS